MNSKKCIKCEETKIYRNYYKNGDKYFKQCKECVPEHEELIESPHLILELHSSENIFFSSKQLIDYLNNGTTKWNYIQRIVTKDTQQLTFDDTDVEEKNLLLQCVEENSFGELFRKNNLDSVLLDENDGNNGNNTPQENNCENVRQKDYIPDGKLHYDIKGQVIYLPDGEKITLTRALIDKWSLQYVASKKEDYLDLEYRKLRMIEDVGVNTNTDEENIEKIVTLEKIYANEVQDSHKTRDYKAMKELSEMINKLRSASGFSGKDILDKATSVTADSLGSYIDSIENDKLIMEHLNPINKESFGIQDDAIDILLTDYLRNSLGLDGMVKKEDDLVWNELEFTKLDEEAKYKTASTIMEKLKDKHEKGEIN